MSFDPDLTACAALVERADPWRFRCAMAAPVAARRILFPLYAFNIEVARAPWVTKETMIAEMRLQWWRDVCEEIAKGGPPRRHEVATPLAQAITPADAALLDELVAARRWDIYRDAFEDQDHFERYIGQTSGNLTLIAARRLGPVNEAVLRDAAHAIGVAAFLRAIPELEAAGRIPLIDGSPEGLRHLADSALRRLYDARRLRREISRAAAPALLAAPQAEIILKIVRSEPSRVATGNLPDPQASLSFPLRALTARW
ncbi:squalene/phytoene synthase family protein [Sulfitobacter aestuarii]|uniref:Squalene/phytoene synthase family protein n=1 Tax=Sulfitobacter aestuarii TaxID=2161676 RepID=A0ABW5TYJ1_9RHOB